MVSLHNAARTGCLRLFTENITANGYRNLYVAVVSHHDGQELVVASQTFRFKNKTDRDVELNSLKSLGGKVVNHV